MQGRREPNVGPGKILVEKKTVSEVLKTWYFRYSAFWPTGKWQGGNSPPSGYAAVSNHVFNGYVSLERPN